jgi:DNA-binding beta-propeller fold protein YncE
VAADADGRVYAPDAERRRVMVYSPRGDVLGELGGPGSVSFDVAPRQVAIGPAQPRSLYVLGNEGVLRVDLDNTAPPPQGSGEVDVVSPIVIALLLALPIAALVLRRGRTRRALVSAPADGEVGLQPKNGAQRQHQQAGPDQDLVVPDQAQGEDQPRDKDNQAVRDRQSRHRA